MDSGLKQINYIINSFFITLVIVVKSYYKQSSPILCKNSFKWLLFRKLIFWNLLYKFDFGNFFAYLGFENNSVPCQKIVSDEIKYKVHQRSILKIVCNFSYSYFSQQICKIRIKETCCPNVEVNGLKEVSLFVLDTIDIRAVGPSDFRQSMYIEVKLSVSILLKQICEQQQEQK